MAPLESVVDALEMDLSHPFHDDRAKDATKHELECVHISAGDVGDGTGLRHECPRVAEFEEAQTRRPSRRLVLVETQVGGGARFGRVVYAWEDDHGEDPAEEVIPWRVVNSLLAVWMRRQCLSGWQG